ncbi:MAG: hypothetical protein V4671_05545 [Armatimonadota bacterium]
MLNAFPVQPDPELLIEPLRVPGPRRVQYAPWVSITRLFLLNGWILGVLCAHLLVTPAQGENLWIVAGAAALIFLTLESYFRRRRHLLSCGIATVGSVVSRKVIRNPNQKSESYCVHYCYWVGEDQVLDTTIMVSKRVYDGCPSGFPITILYDPRSRTSLPLLLLNEAQLT